MLMEDVLNRDNEIPAPVHIFNINTKDNHEEAAVSAAHALQLVQLVTYQETYS